MAGRVYINDSDGLREIVDGKRRQLEKKEAHIPSLRIWLSTTSGEKRNLMRALGEGAEKEGFEVDYCLENHTEVPPKDYNFIFAYKSDGVSSPTHNLREKVVAASSGNQVFFLDSNVLKYYEKDIRYFRIPYRSIHPDNADYMARDGEAFKKVDQIKKDLGIELKPMRTNGDHILLVLNRGFGGFSAFGKGCYEWAKETVEELRKHTQRPILIRSHNHAKITAELAEDKKNLDYILKTYDNIKHTAFGESDLVENLKNAWACVCYTSTSGAVALIEGIPLFTTHQACFSKMYSSGQLEDIENPKEVDREKFLADYATAHWSLDEMKDGTFWRKFKKYYIKK
jgi:hypothetical protein